METANDIYLVAQGGATIVAMLFVFLSIATFWKNLKR